MSELEFMVLFHDTLENMILWNLNLWGGEHGTFPHPADKGVHCEEQLWGEQRKVRYGVQNDLLFSLTPWREETMWDFILKHF